jgi:hypothetical protein
MLLHRFVMKMAILLGLAGSMALPAEVQAQVPVGRPGTVPIQQFQGLAAIQQNLANAALARQFTTTSLLRPEVRQLFLNQQALQSALIASQRPAAILNGRRFFFTDPFFGVTTPFFGFSTFHYSPADYAQDYYLRGLIQQEWYQNQALTQMAWLQQNQNLALHSQNAALHALLAAERRAAEQRQAAPPAELLKGIVAPADGNNGNNPAANGKNENNPAGAFRDAPGERELELARLWRQVNPEKARALYEEALRRAPAASNVRLQAQAELEELAGG